MINVDNIYTDIYNTLLSTNEKLYQSMKLLNQYDYLNAEENALLQKVIYLSFRKLVRIGEDITQYNDFETEDIPLPESEVEFTKGVM